METPAARAPMDSGKRGELRGTITLPPPFIFFPSHVRASARGFSTSFTLTSFPIGARAYLLRYSIFPVDNEELVAGDWESKIIWDADDWRQIAAPPLLTLDPNDENIVIGMPEDVVKETDKDGADKDARGGGGGGGGRRGREKPDRTRTQVTVAF